MVTSLMKMLDLPGYIATSNFVSDVKERNYDAIIFI